MVELQLLQLFHDCIGDVTDSNGSRVVNLVPREELAAIGGEPAVRAATSAYSLEAGSRRNLEIA
jgi:hypothetical protein